MRPCQGEIRVGRRPIGIGHERIEPDEIGRSVGLDVGIGGGIEHEGAEQEIEAQVQAPAPMDEVLELLVEFGVADPWVDVDQDELRNGQPDGPGDLAGQPFRDECARALPAPWNLTT